MSGPMDPARLALLELEASLMRVSMIPTSVLSVAGLIGELLGARTHWETEAKRWRSECPVTAAHVEAAGVTLAHCERWGSDRAFRFELRDGFVRVEGTDGNFGGHTGFDLSELITVLAEHLGRPTHDILDEMAALTADEATKG